MNLPHQKNNTVVRPKILIVDDQPLNIRVLNELLHDEFDVFMATDGGQAIHKAEILNPDLILLDVVMPVMDGYEVCRQLKLNPLTIDIPIIFVTAHFDEAEEVRGFALGAVDFIHKPINPVITKARVNTQVIAKQHREQLRSIALVDGLTGIPNRRRFDDDLAKHWAHCTRTQQHLSLLIIDIDFFKKYNDRFGHQKGDVCLQTVAQTIQSSLNRPFDLAARYGGEEFVCLLPNTNAEGAMHIAAKILSHVSDLKIEHPDSLRDQIVTVSIGVASQIPADGEQPNRLVEDADKRLYIAKRNGRAGVIGPDS